MIPCVQISVHFVTVVRVSSNICQTLREWNLGSLVQIQKALVAPHGGDISELLSRMPELDNNPKLTNAYQTTVQNVTKSQWLWYNMPP